MHFDLFVSKIMHDEDFRAELKADPEAALAKEGVDATPEMVQAIHNLDWNSMQKVSDHYKAMAGVSC